MITNVTDKIKYIGVDDLDIDLFESQYVVPNGVSYNSYLILDDKVAIMDTVDSRKSDEWLDNLDRALEGRKPDYLVVQHLEPDHAGTIDRVMARYPAYMGDIVGDLNRRRGQINAMDSTLGARIVKAYVPLAEQFGYVTILRTISSGRATSTMAFDHYAEVPAGLAKEVIEKSGYKNTDDDE